MPVHHLLALLAAICCLAGQAAALPAAVNEGTGQASPVGYWLTAGGDGVIRIAPCGADLCGWIVGIKLRSPWQPTPKDWQGRSQCGLQIIADAAPDGDAWHGTILDPRDGDRYNARFHLDDSGQLKLRGYILTPLFGQTQTWTRFPGPIPDDCRIYPVERREPRVAR